MSSQTDAEGGSGLSPRDPKDLTFVNAVRIVFKSQQLRTSQVSISRVDIFRAIKRSYPLAANSIVAIGTHISPFVWVVVFQAESAREHIDENE